MRKYWAFCRTNMQGALAYRGPLLIWLVSSLLALFSTIAVWMSASAGNLIGGYSKPQLVSYYLATLLLSWMTNWQPFYPLRGEISNGEIVLTTLSKPISLFKRAFAEELGWHLVSFWFGLFASLILVLLMKQNITFNFSVAKILLIIPAVVLSTLITFSISLCMGMVAFWFTEIEALSSVFWITRLFLGGQGIPISFLPEFMQTTVRILPFRYMVSFPLEILFDKLSPGQAFLGFFIGIIWIIAFIFLYRLMFEKGRKAYTSFGQ